MAKLRIVKASSGLGRRKLEALARRGENLLGGEQD